MDGAVDYSASRIVIHHDDAFERLEAQITELWGHLNAATYKLLVLIAKFDRERAYERHNLVNTAQWLNWQCGIGGVAAREKVRVARALEQLPKISAAFASGEISYSKVRAMTRVATPKNEPVLVNIARYGTASHVEKLVRRYRWTQRRDAAKQAESQQLNRQVHYFYDEDDNFVLNARLSPEVGALVLKALQVAGDILREESRAETDSRLNVSAGTSKMKHQEHSHGAKRADALQLMAERFLASTSEEVEGTASGDRFQVVVHIDRAVLTSEIAAQDDEPHRCELDAGPALALETARRLSCDSTLVGIVEGPDGDPLNIGRKTRSIPPPIARALRSRDGGCRFPGCDRTRFTKGHHIIHWADGGETKLSNLISLCGFHHRLLHEGGFGVNRTDDGVFVFTRPDGKRIPECGPRPAVAATATGSVYAEPDCAEPPEECFRGNIDESPLMGDAALAQFEQSLKGFAAKFVPGVPIDASTARCKWLGERMDYSNAIESMQLREHGCWVNGTLVEYVGD
jgi:hypothetical protein